MLPKHQRLNEKADFRLVLKKGTMHHSRLLGLSILETEDRAKKAGIIVSNKVSKRATERNRIRRVLREALKERIDAIPEGRKLVFLVKAQANEMDNAVIKKEAFYLLSKC